MHHSNIIAMVRGNPCIRGLRITAYNIIEYLACGMTQQDILESFPYLTADDISACLSYISDPDIHLAWRVKRKTAV